MHQTFYIDIDEEITSIVERIRKINSSEIIIVVPKRALLIQSIVNLKILKKEIEELGVQLMIITQDKLGKILIEKAGILVQQRMDNMPEEEINLAEEMDEEFSKERKKIINESQEFSIGNDRLKSIGSNNYFDEEYNSLRKKKTIIKKETSEGNKEKLINRELVTSYSKTIGDIRKNNFSQKNSIESEREEEAGAVRKLSKNFLTPDSGPLKNENVESFFHQENKKEEKNKRLIKKNFENYNLSKKVRKMFWFFGIISSLIVLGIIFYLFIPKAQVSISPKTELKSIDSEVTGKTDVNLIDLERGFIPAKKIEFNEEITKTYNATGDKAISNQKARGTVMIYNEYDKNPQPLVATTRFMSDGGKLFRLINPVTVPGMLEKDGQVERGSVEAQVVADQSGEDFNIEPTKFTIPGFQNSGNEKYTKFYAESKEKMSGGGGGSEKVNVITAGDISSAKEDISSEIEKKLKSKLDETMGGDFIILEGAVQKEEAVYKLSNSENDTADFFNVSIKSNSLALAINKKDLIQVVDDMISKSSGSLRGIDRETVRFDFGKPNVNFSSESIDIKFKAIAELKPEFDLELIKENILGKSEENLVAYLGSFSDIEKIKVEYTPSFLSGRIPFRKNQIILKLDKE